MRDHPHHYYKILGGMWGFKNTITIDFNTLLLLTVPLSGSLERVSTKLMPQKIIPLLKFLRLKHWKKQK